MFYKLQWNQLVSLERNLFLWENRIQGENQKVQDSILCEHYIFSTSFHWHPAAPAALAAATNKLCLFL